MSLIDTLEYQRLHATTERRADWKRWGPYLSERAWDIACKKSIESI